MQRFFHGWLVAGAAGIGMACGVAVIVGATFGVFLAPLRQEFGWSPSDAYVAVIVATLTAASLSPFAGALADRFGARRIIIGSFVCEALVLASFSMQSGSLAAFYVRYFLLVALGLGTTHIAFARVISMWFDRRRGLALGIALAGTGLGGFVLPLLAQGLIETRGWRDAYLGLAAVIGFGALPLMALTMRDTPESRGLTVDGAGRPRSLGEAATRGATLREAASRPFYYMMLATFFLIGIVLQSVILHTVPLATERGLSPMLAALVQSMLFLALVVGRLSTGWLIDRFFAPRVAVAFLLGPLAGIALLVLTDSAALALAAALLIGLAAGAEVDVLAFLTSRYYGLKHFSRIYGTCAGAYFAAGGVGPWLTALAVERTGGYFVPLCAHAAVVVACCLLLARFPAFPREYAPAAEARASDGRRESRAHGSRLRA